MEAKRQRMLDQQLHILLLKRLILQHEYQTALCVVMQMHKGACVCLCIAGLDQAAWISLSLDARLAARGKMISRLHKYCLSAIDGCKCTNSVFWGGVRGKGEGGVEILAYFPSRELVIRLTV